ncbi:MAG: hypothetical protein WB791_09460 [Waddliaceae bacterium]
MKTNGFAPIRDGAGIVGSLFHYSLLIALVGSAFLIFVYLWKTNRLDMDEEPKMQMMQNDEEDGEGG